MIQQQQRLLLLRHASECPAEGKQCKATPHCQVLKGLWNHVAQCKNPQCQVGCDWLVVGRGDSHGSVSLCQQAAGADCQRSRQAQVDGQLRSSVFFKFAVDLPSLQAWSEIVSGVVVSRVSHNAKFQSRVRTALSRALFLVTPRLHVPN